MADTNKGVPLRQRASASYSPTDGRAAKSSEGPQDSYSADGERWSVSRQIGADGALGKPSGHGTSSLGWGEIDRNRSTKTSDK
jgi:hypothetical protein